MTTTAPSAEARRARWGWRVLMLLGVLMILDGAWLFLAIGGGAVFESDTGAQMSEVASAYPAVVEVMNRRGELLGLLVAGLGAVTLLATVGGRTNDGRLAVAAVGGTSLAVAGYLVAAGNLEVAVVYAVFAFLAAVGLGLARGQRSP